MTNKVVNAGKTWSYPDNKFISVDVDQEHIVFKLFKGNNFELISSIPTHQYKKIHDDYIKHVELKFETKLDTVEIFNFIYYSNVLEDWDGC